MSFVNYVLAKPLYVEELDSKLGLFERQAELEDLLVNETSQSREKRDIVEGLRSLLKVCEEEENQHLNVYQLGSIAKLVI